MSGSKQCRKCKKTKILNEFYVSRRNPDGLTTMCKNCVKEYNAYYSSQNRHNMNAKQRQKWRETHLERGHRSTHEVRRTQDSIKEKL